MIKYKFLRVIGDVHGCINIRHPRKDISYLDIIKNCSCSVQLGDMGFNYTGLKDVGNSHVFIPGNHDNYDDLPVQAIGDYGLFLLRGFNFFYVRGAWSIDINQRIDAMLSGAPRIWWGEEELAQDEMDACFDMYMSSLPEVVMTHECPTAISELVGNPGVWKHFGWENKVQTRTQTLLQDMFEHHKPKLWLFGHYHRNWTRTVDGTTFMCIDELNYVDFNEKWEIV